MGLELSFGPSRPKIMVNRRTDALLGVDAQETFMPGGQLAVAGGDEIIPVILRNVLPISSLTETSDLYKHFPLFDKQRCIVTIDRHPWGHVSYASSFIGTKPRDILITVDTVLRGPRNRRVTVSIAPHAKFTKKELAAYLKKVGSQILWPDHGLAGVSDQLHSTLRIQQPFSYALVKGIDGCCDSYSAFKDNRGRLTELADILRRREVRRVFVWGLAEDFCVGWTALDARELGFEAVVLEDATRAVNIPGTKRKPGSLETIRRKFAKAGVVIARTTDLVAA